MKNTDIRKMDSAQLIGLAGSNQCGWLLAVKELRQRGINVKKKTNQLQHDRMTGDNDQFIAKQHYHLR